MHAHAAQSATIDGNTPSRRGATDAASNGNAAEMPIVARADAHADATLAPSDTDDPASNKATVTSGASAQARSAVHATA